MDEIKVKIKEQVPSDEQLLKRKDFNSSYKTYVGIKNSYARITALWGAAIGMAVFVGFVGVKLMDNQQNNQEIVIKEKQLSVNQSSNEKLNNSAANIVSKTEKQSELNKNNTEHVSESNSSKKETIINKTSAQSITSNEVTKSSEKLNLKNDSIENKTSENSSKNRKQQKGINIQYIAD